METSNERRKFSKDQNNINSEENNRNNNDLDDKSKKSKRMMQEQEERLQQQPETHVRLSKLDNEQAALIFENRKKQLCDNLLSQMKRSNSSNSLRSTNSPRIPLTGSTAKPSPRLNSLQQQQSVDTDTCNSNSSRFHYNSSQYNNNNYPKELKMNKHVGIINNSNTSTATTNNLSLKSLHNKNSQFQKNVPNNNIPNASISTNNQVGAKDRGSSNGKLESNRSNNINIPFPQNGMKPTSSQLMYKTRGNNSNNNYLNNLSSNNNNYTDIFNFKRASENIDVYDSPMEKQNIWLVDKAAYGSNRTLSTARFPSEKVISSKNGNYSSCCSSNNTSPQMKGLGDAHASKLAATPRTNSSLTERSSKENGGVIVVLDEEQQEKQESYNKQKREVDQQHNLIDIYSFNKINSRKNSSGIKQADMQYQFLDNPGKISAFMQGYTERTTTNTQQQQQQQQQPQSNHNSITTSLPNNNNNPFPLTVTYQSSSTASNRLMKQLSSASLPAKQSTSSSKENYSSRQSKKQNQKQQHPKSSQSHSSSNLSSSSSHHLSIDLKKLASTSKATSPETSTRAHLKPQRISSQTLRYSYSSTQSLQSNRKGSSSSSNMKNEEIQKQQQEIQPSKDVIMTVPGAPAGCHGSSYRHSGMVPQPFDLLPPEPHEDEGNEVALEDVKIAEVIKDSELSNSGKKLEELQHQQEQKQQQQQQFPLKLNTASIQRSSSSSSSQSFQNQLSSQSSLATPEIRTKLDTKNKKQSKSSNTSSPALDAAVMRNDPTIIPSSSAAMTTAPLAFSLSNYNSNIFTFYNTSTGISVVPSSSDHPAIQNYAYSDRYATATKRKPSNAQSIASSSSSSMQSSSMQLCTPISPASGCPLPPKQSLLSQQKQQQNLMTSQQQLLNQQIHTTDNNKIAITTTTSSLGHNNQLSPEEQQQQQQGVQSFMKKQQDISAQMEEVRQQSQALISKQLAKKRSGSASYQQIFSNKIGKEQQQAINEAFRKKTCLVEMSPCAKQQADDVQGFQEKCQSSMQASNSKSGTGKRSNSTSMTSQQLMQYRKSSDLGGISSTTTTPGVERKSNSTSKDIPKTMSDNLKQSPATATSYSKNYATMNQLQKDKAQQSGSYTSLQLSTFSNIYQRNTDRGRESSKIIQKRKQSDDLILKRNTSNDSMKIENINRHNTANNSPNKVGILQNNVKDVKDMINMQSSRENSLKTKTKTNMEGIQQQRGQIDKKSISTTEESQPSKEELEIIKQHSTSQSNSPTKSKKIHFSNQNLSFTAAPSGDKTPLKSILVNGKNSSNEKQNRNQGDFTDFSQTSQANLKQLFDIRQLQQEIPDTKSKIMHNSFNNDNRNQLKNNNSQSNNIFEISQRKRNNSNHCIGSQISQVPIASSVDARSPLLLSKRTNNNVQQGCSTGIKELLLLDFRPKSIGLKGKQPGFYQENVIAQKINSNESLSSEVLKLNKIASDIKSISAMFSQANMRQQVMKTGGNLNTKKEQGI